MTQETTFNLAKGLYHVRNAIHYFEHVKKQPEVRFDRKHFVGMQIGKLNGVLNDFTASLPTDSARILRAELESDTMAFEAINDKLINLCESDRWKVEEYIDSILKNTTKSPINP